ncbi:MAG: hypothetical protein ACI8TX_000391 [Hyphomicrobiaceae bacterium]|jgi:hypothetical protein
MGAPEVSGELLAHVANPAQPVEVARIPVPPKRASQVAFRSMIKWSTTGWSAVASLSHLHWHKGLGLIER